jgi:hypothetical protein
LSCQKYNRYPLDLKRFRAFPAPAREWRTTSSSA